MSDEQILEFVVLLKKFDFSECGHAVYTSEDNWKGLAPGAAASVYVQYEEQRAAILLHSRIQAKEADAEATLQISIEDKSHVLQGRIHKEFDNAVAYIYAVLRQHGYYL
jgi:hypothetical protein